MLKSFFDDNKKLIIFIISFLLSYYFFKGYISITDQLSLNFMPFVFEHLNIVKGYRNFLLQGSKYFVESFGYTTNIHDDYFIKINNKNQVQIVYSCLGFGVISFWISFILSNVGSYLFKFLWLVGGIIILSFLNILRLSLILIWNYWNYPPLFPIDHHTTFNIFSYILIFLLMLGYLKSLDINIDKKENPF